MPSNLHKSQQDLLELIFSSQGPLSLVMDQFEERKGQREMAEQILEAYSQDQVALIEAGTGIGKSMAYLVPAIFWALKFQEKTVISTHTISLQEQLIHKDIPFLLKALDLDLKASLVKGMNNYLCLRKLDDQIKQLNLLIDSQELALEAIERWSQRTVEGSHSEINFPITPSVWEKVEADKDSCNHVHCPHYKKCFFFKARRKCSEAQILVVNHHLLLADLISKQNRDAKADKSILPAYHRLILDEAHQFEDIAFEALSKRVDNVSPIKYLNKFFSEIQPQKTRLSQIKALLSKSYLSDDLQKWLSLIDKREADLLAKKKEAIEHLFEAFDHLKLFCAQHFKAPLQNTFRENSFLLKKEILEQPDWSGLIKEHFAKLSALLQSFVLLAQLFCKELSEIKDPFIEEKIQMDLSDMLSIASRLEEYALNVDSFFQSAESPERVRWIESSSVHDRYYFSLVEANLDVSTYLHQHLLQKTSTVAMCSATMTIGAGFKYIRDRLGIRFAQQEKAVTEKIYESPFDFENQSLFLVVKDIPDPSDPTFVEEASKKILKCILSSQGNAFVLFTSYDMLQSCYDEVVKQSQDYDFNFFKQGEASRQLLIEKFKMHENSVLFGTDSFWEGVDVAGDALRLVILAKLPFRVPNHPKAQAYSEYLLGIGKDPFRDFSLAQAVLKFKQGFGRLIRSRNDRGCVVCLDRRIITKPYGKTFLKSLPKCKVISENSEAIFEVMRDFYRKESLTQEFEEKSR